MPRWLWQRVIQTLPTLHIIMCRNDTLDKNPSPTSAREMTKARRSPWRIGLKVAGTVITIYAILLTGIGFYDVGAYTLLGVGVALLALSRYWQAVAHWRAASRRHGHIWVAGWICFAAWLLTVALFLHRISSTADATHYSGPPPAAIIVLGAGTASCRLHPILIGRLEEGLTQAQRWPQSKVVVSGGEGSGLGCHEANIMADYLFKNGLSRDRVISEPMSLNTWAGILFSRLLLQGEGITGKDPVLVVTSDFHVPRAKRLARKAGFAAAAVVGIKTPWPIRLNTSLQEYFASINSWVFDEN
ncbi:YdcF family protein [Cupriavidus taiwanensis]|uniref:YdcF family protein n=1 Tax=Cupriavidus taiwanensis TaxID=164546 RepID=UPI002541A74C|nr:YdcF family protein [Cupriavidus taiwanensis]MDK3021618.1 YdcF family protein [Cupriavidus taiwanensis]